MTQWGRVVASHGRHVVVEDAQGERRLCHPRGKKNQAVVGDLVQWLASEDEGSIESIDTRRNLFYRQDDIRTKSFAANLDRLNGNQAQLVEATAARAAATKASASVRKRAAE